MQVMLIRFLDILIATIGMVLLMPVWVIFAIWITLDSSGGIFYRQVRTGRGGVPFQLIKFRTMFTGSDKAGLLTIGGNDQRITKSGNFLRKYKLDEMPQLWNVLVGDMSMVGPRPEVSKYTKLYTTEQKIILSVRPGITDQASIVFRNENDILATKNDPETYYKQIIMPLKITHNLPYVQNPNVARYLTLIYKTFIVILRS